MSISRYVKGRTLDAAYDYLNWWISGWPGAIMDKRNYFGKALERFYDGLKSGLRTDSCDDHEHIPHLLILTKICGILVCSAF